LSWTWIVVAVGYVLIAIVTNGSLSLAACTRSYKSFSLDLRETPSRFNQD